MASAALGAVLGLSRPMVVSLIGAGGKTTLLYRLGRELAAAGKAVLLTTTTHMYHPSPGEADEVVLAGRASDLAGAVAGKLRAGRCLFLAREREGEKVVGLAPAMVDRLAAAWPEVYVLVEADGAARRPCKGYAPHEPAVPRTTALLVGIAGLDALGQPLTSVWVHRPEMVAAVTGLAPGARLAPEDLALTLAVGLRRGMAVLSRGRAVAWLNKVNRGRLAGARRAARALLAEAFVEKVVLGAAAAKEAVHEVWAGDTGPCGVAGIVLAAGTSSRMAGQKLLLPLGNKSVLEHVVDLALSLPLAPVIVVLGHQAEALVAVLGRRPVVLARNPAYAQGQSTSVRAALAALPSGVRAAVFFLGDQPLIRRQVVETLLKTYQETGAPAVYPTYTGRRGNPVLFDRRAFTALAGCQGDEGGRTLLAGGLAGAVAVPVDDPGILLDIDTAADYERARQWWAGGSREDGGEG